MKVLSEQIVFQEVPNEISLSFLIAWCPLKCEGCHSKEWNNWNQWFFLTEEEFNWKIEKYKWMITCVLFLWWEWHNEELIKYLKIARWNWLKTCLYTWLLNVKKDLKEHLSYLKTWPWIKSLWWLDSKNTNQKLINVNNWENLNHYFQK